MELEKKKSYISTTRLALDRARDILEDEIAHIHPDNYFDSARDLCKYALDLLQDDPEVLQEFEWDINNYSAALRHYDDHKDINDFTYKYHHIDDWFSQYCNW